MLIQVIGAFLGIISVTVVYGIDRKFMIQCGIGGAAGWFIYLITERFLKSNSFCIYIATFAVALFAHMFARKYKAPVTIFLIPGILTLVPGIGMYRSIYAMIMDNREAAGEYMTETMQIAGCIALAIFSVDTIFRYIPRYKKVKGKSS